MQIVDFVSLRDVLGWLRQRVLSQFHDWDARSLTTCWPPRPASWVALVLGQNILQRWRSNCRSGGSVAFPRLPSSHSTNDRACQASPASISRDATSVHSNPVSANSHRRPRIDRPRLCQLFCPCFFPSDPQVTLRSSCRTSVRPHLFKKNLAIGRENDKIAGS